jgi:nucleotide-binding universal stress UspA family protein
MPYLRSKLQRILVSIDGSNSSMRAADYAISIARKNNSQLIALHVLFSELKYAYSHHILGFVTPTKMNSEIEDARTQANQWFKILENKISMKDLSGKYSLKTDFLVTDKSIPHAIVKYAEDHDIDLTVVGTRGKSGLTRMVLGSVASSVVIYSSCPVLIIR